MATTNNGYSDLIHLFIDGEASEVERNTLFNALKDSPELQEEFSSAMRLKQAFSADIMQLQPPSYLQSQIAERAGILVAASATAANAPVVVNALSNAVSNVAPVATGILSKGVITMLVGASVGVLSTVGIIKLTSNNSTKNISPAVPQTVTRQAEPSHIPPSFIAPATITPMEMTKSSFVNRGSSVVNTNTSTDFGQSVKEERANVHSTESQISENQLLTTDEEQKVENSATVENSKPEFTIGTITPTAAYSPVPKAIGDNGSKRGFFGNTLPYTGKTSGSRFSAFYTKIITSKLYQGSNTVIVPLLDNFEVGVKYDLDPSTSIRLELGAEYGHETFPVYISDNNGGYDNYNSISWYGPSLTVSAINLKLPFNSYPAISVLGAWSDAGPIFKSSLGIILPVTEQASFSVTGEETMLFIKSNGTNITGNKVALTGALIFHF